MISETCLVKISNNAKYWHRLGYPLLKQGEQLFVKTSELLPNSCVLVVVTCDLCGKSRRVKYQTYKKYSKSGGVDKCHRCAASQNARSMKGPKHPNWNSKITPEDREKIRRHRYHENHSIKTWRKAVFERDEYTCQNCKRIGEKLQAHHIDCWIDFPDKRYLIDNGITLCASCHKALHHICGQRTTRKDYLNLSIF